PGRARLRRARRSWTVDACGTSVEGEMTTAQSVMFWVLSVNQSSGGMCHPSFVRGCHRRGLLDGVADLVQADRPAPTSVKCEGRAGGCGGFVRRGTASR